MLKKVYNLHIDKIIYPCARVNEIQTLGQTKIFHLIQYDLDAEKQGFFCQNMISNAEQGMMSGPDGRIQ